MNSHRNLSRIEKDLVLRSIALDIAIECLEKLTGKKGGWREIIEQQALEGFNKIPPEKLKEFLRRDHGN